MRKTVLNIRIQPEVKEKLKELAKLDGRTLSDYAARVLAEKAAQ